MYNFIEKYWIKNNLHVSFAFASLTAYVQKCMGDFEWNVIAIAFFSTLAVYNFTRIGGFESLRKNIALFSVHVLFFLVGTLGLFFFFFRLDFNLLTLVWLVFLSILSFTYSLPFSSIGLRTVPFFKLFLIAFVWAGASVGLVLIENNLFPINTFFAAIFLFIIGITIPFDIRDSITDEDTLKTLPQVIGIKKSKIIAIAALCFSAFLCCIYFKFIITSQLVAWLLAVFVSVILLFKASLKKHEFYVDFWIESCSYLPLIFYLIIKLL